MAVHKQKHFLLLTVEAQGHINPARRLASRLVSSGRARVTLAFPTSAYRRIFPSTEVAEDGHELISYTHYPNPPFDASKFVPSEINLHIKDSLSCIATDLAASGRPVTCIIYSLFLSGVAELARDLGIPSVLFWIQPAAVFAVYYYYFHGYTDIIRAHQNDPSFSVALPGLPPLQIRDLPSFLTSTNFDANPLHAFVGLGFKDMFETLDREAACKPRVIVNTFQELENEVLSSIQTMEMITVGPLVSSEQTNLKHSPDLYQDSRGYMEWLDRQAERSVVYLSFGSIFKMSGRQMEEIARGLAESGRRYLWVVRENNGGEVVRLPEGEEEMGMVVEWCSQNRVLSHRSIGCFVTHCGWNSTLESMLYGVPMVMAPQWSDQLTNARLAEGEWGTGVRAELDEEGVLMGRELTRCLDVVMEEEGKREAEIRIKIAMWKDKAVEAVGQGGSSFENLKAFVESMDAIEAQATPVTSSSQ